LQYFGDQNPVGTFLETLSRFLNRNIGNLTMLPGHGWSFDNPSERARQEMEHYLEKSEWYYQKCTHGMNSAWEIALDIYREKGCKSKLRSVLRETMAYMEYLAANGRVIKETHSDGFRFLT
jgi:hypothetical protein